MAEDEGEAEEGAGTPETYFQRIAKIDIVPGDAALLEEWSQAQGITPQEHAESVFAQSAVDSCARAEMVMRALEVQDKFLKDKRSRKSEKLVRAAHKAMEMARAESKSGYSKARAIAAAAFVEVSEMTTKWTLVQAFSSREEGLTFILQCQAFQYRPIGVDCPHFEDGNAAVSFMLSSESMQQEFVSLDPQFRRRLRLRQAAQNETQEQTAQMRAKMKQRSLAGRSVPHDAKERWVVEAAGNLFESSPLRSLSEKPAQRYYIAVPPEIEKKVLVEGYQPSKRTSVPCSATPQEAASAYLAAMRRSKEEREQSERKRKSQAQGESLDRAWDLWEWTAASELYPVLGEDKRGFKATVLAVVVPQELGFDIVANKGGFLIKTGGKVLPASCFSRVKRSDAP